MCTVFVAKIPLLMNPHLRPSLGLNLDPVNAQVNPPQLHPPPHPGDDGDGGIPWGREGSQLPLAFYPPATP